MTINTQDASLSKFTLREHTKVPRGRAFEPKEPALFSGPVVFLNVYIRASALLFVIDLTFYQNSSTFRLDPRLL